MVDIEKPLTDDRSYRVITLPNGLEALLVQDPKTDKAAAALDVGVGAYMDPEDLPGLAHFLEHLLFMGTEKYPSENEYAQYLTDHAGTFNAYTAAERTNFYFEVAHEYLSGALDRFSQFFIAPLFSASCTARELCAVDSENKKNLQNDVWRIMQVEKHLSNPAHPVHKFSTGNTETLGSKPQARGVDVRAEIIKFYKQYYTASAMKLVIIGRENLDDLEKLAAQFKAVPDPHPELARQIKPYNLIDPLTPSELGKFVRVETVMDMKLLEIQFPVPEQQVFHETQPFYYYVQLLGHESKGSLLHLLKAQSLATELACATTRISGRTDYLLVTIELTNAGLLAWKDVVAALFAYISMVKSQPVQKWIFDEIMDTSATKFRYREKGSTRQLASTLAQTLHRPIPRSRLLSYAVPLRFDEDAIVNFGEYLVPRNSRVLLASQDSSLPNVEPWYGTKFSVEDLPALPVCSRSRELHLPKPNPFISRNFELVKPVITAKQTRPRIVLKQPGLRVWHKQDDSFGIPKAHCHFKLANPNCASLKSTVLADLFVSMVNDTLTDYSYYAEVADVHYALEARPTGFEIKVYGFTGKLLDLIQMVVNAVMTTKMSGERFVVVHEQRVRSTHNALYSEPYLQADKHAMTVLAEKTYPIKSKLEELQNTSFHDLERYVAGIRAQGFQLEVLCVGNASVESAIQAANLAFQQLTKLDSPAIVRPQSYMFPPGVYYYNVELEDKNNKNSFTEVLYQFGDAHDLHANAVLTLVSQIMREPSFAQLRTKEQLGYIVGASKRQVRSTLWLVIFVQSEELTTFLDLRIENFVANVLLPMVSKMTDQEFQLQIDAVVSECLERFKNIDEESYSYWGSIVSGFYDFHKKHAVAELVKSITKEEVLGAIQKYLLQPSRTRLALHLNPKQRATPSPESALAKIVGSLMIERSISVPGPVIEAFMLECRGLQPQQAMQKLVERLAEHTDLTIEQAGGFAQEAMMRLAKVMRGETASDVPVLGVPLTVQVPHTLAPVPSPTEDIAKMDTYEVEKKNEVKDKVFDNSAREIDINEQEKRESKCPFSSSSSSSSSAPKCPFSSATKKPVSHPNPGPRTAGGVDLALWAALLGLLVYLL